MNMRSVFVPDVAIEPARPRQRIGEWVAQRRMLIGIVFVPLLAISAYLFLFASDQYESEAHFLVRSSQTQNAAPVSGIGQILSAATGASNSQSEAMSVADYLISHDAVATLRRESGLVARYRRAGIDLFDRLWSDDPTPERLLSFYRRHVTVEYGTDTGITTLKVRSFSPDDSFILINKLLALGEARVNLLNQRSYADALSGARRQLAEAEDGVSSVQTRMTQFRARRADIDPTASGQAQIGLVSGLTQQLAAARAQLKAMGGLISPSSPQYRAVEARVSALAAQIALQSGRLAGSGDTIANDIGGYEDLKLRQEFAAKRYEAAAANLQEAREQARRQQLYLVRIVNPNLPVKSTYPKRFQIVGSAAVALFLVYAIVWLLIAGVREHAA